MKSKQQLIYEEEKRRDRILVILFIMMLTLLGIFMCIDLLSAVTIYPGETYQYNSGLDEIIDWKIIKNNSYINATQVSNSSINITIPELEDNLTFSLEVRGYKNEEEKVVYLPSSGGGGGSRTRIEYKNQTKTIFLNDTKTIIKTEYVNNTCSESFDKTVDYTRLPFWKYRYFIASIPFIVLGILIIWLVITLKSSHTFKYLL